MRKRVLNVAQVKLFRLAPISTGVKNYALSLLPAEDRKNLRDFDSSTRKDLVRLGPRIVFGCDVKDSFLATYFHILPSLDILFQSFFIHIIYKIIYVYNHTIYIYIYRKSH